jgi:putative transposase
MVSHMKPLDNGLSKIKLKFKKHKVVIEDTMSLKNKLKKNLSQSFMQECHQPNKNLNSKTKSTSSNPNTPIINLLPISDLESISKEKVLSPFWTKYLNQKSKKLWLPTKTDLQDLDLKSLNMYHKSLDAESKLFQKKNITLQKNSPKILYPLLQSSVPDITDFENIQKSRKVRIYPNLNQKELFHKCFSISRYIYNQCVEHNNNLYQQQLLDIKESNFCCYTKYNKNEKTHEECNNNKYEESFFCQQHLTKKVKWNTIANPITMRENVIIKDKDLSDDNIWLKEIPYDTKELMVRSYCNALKIAMKSNSKFSMSFKSKKNNNQIFFINKKTVSDVDNNHIHIFKRRLKNNNKIKKKKKEIIKVKQNSIIKKEGNRYFVIIPIEEKQEYKKATYDIVSLDPGVRTFQTFYSPNGICGDLNLRKEKLKKLENKIKLLKEINKTKRCYRLRIKINNIISDSHWKIIKFLTSNFNTIIIPHFNSKSMIKKGNSKLNKKTKTDLLAVHHYKFLLKLQFKCKERHRKLIICEESYTSKTCGNCGTLNEKLGSKKIFKCEKCKIEMDRDLNGSRNILLKLL